MRRTWITPAALFIAAVMAAAPSITLAQDDTDHPVDEVRGKRIVIEVDDDGRVIIDGKAFSDDDRSLMLRVRPDDGEVEIERVGPDFRRWREMTGAFPGGQGVFFRREAPDIHIDPPHIPDVEPLMRQLDNLHFEFADPIRLGAREHREVAQLERESRELAREAREAEGAEKSRIEAELREKLTEIYEKKMELRRDRMEELEKKLDAERDALRKRSEAREQMIDRRQRMLMGEGDVLDW